MKRSVFHDQQAYIQHLGEHPEVQRERKKAAKPAMPSDKDTDTEPRPRMDVELRGLRVADGEFAECLWPDFRIALAHAKELVPYRYPTIHNLVYHIMVFHKKGPTRGIQFSLDCIQPRKAG